MVTRSIERRANAIVVPLSREERRRLDAWALEQEREASQAIRYALRNILAAEDAEQRTTPTMS